MYKHFLIFSLAIFISCDKKDTSNLDVNYWFENIGSRTDLLYLPDANVNYFMYSFNRNSGDKIGLRLRASYGNARYMSYNIYDNNTRSSIASLIDTSIIPYKGGNPYRNQESGEYFLDIIPDDVVYSSENVLKYDARVRNVGIMLRYYLPEGDNYAGVMLPTIEAFDITTSKSMTPPTPKAISFEDNSDVLNKIQSLLDLVFLYEDPAQVNFLRFAGLGLYPNKDNNYVFAPVTLAKDQVVVLRFKPPHFPNAKSEYANADVRYYSISLSNSSTYNFNTIADYKFLKASSDGYINLVIAAKDDEIQKKASGLNFMEWKPEMGYRGFIIYRNLATRSNYENSMEKIPDFLSNLSLGTILNPESMYAHNHIGVYAPIGKKMSKKSFLENYGDFPVSF
jgi:uncharacterized membrane protein